MSKTITGLNAGTKYYVAYQYSDILMGGAVYTFGEVTTASAPTGGSANLTLSVTGTTQNSISVSWNTDDTANEASELRYSTSPITAGNFNSATLAQSYSTVGTPSMSRTISGLSSGTTYYIAYKYYSIKNAGEMIATVSASTQTSGGGGGGGGGGGTYYYPKTFDVAKVVINDDAATTATTSVMLTFTTDPIANEVSISNNINDVGTKWILYSTTTPWTLETGDGLKTVYVKFRHASKGYSDVISDTIQLVTQQTPEIVVEPYTPITYTPTTPVTTQAPAGTFNILDFNVMMTNWNESGPVESPSDLTRDTKVDFLDVLSLFKNWVDINIF
jgi:hypothetical protein